MATWGYTHKNKETTVTQGNTHLVVKLLLNKICIHSNVGCDWSVIEVEGDSGAGEP